MLERLKKMIQVPRAISSRASKGILEPRKSEKVDVATLLMSQNRKQRRAFKKQHGIFLRGSTRPLVNASIGK